MPNQKDPKVVSLRAVEGKKETEIEIEEPPYNQEGIISMLENMLEEAKEGNITGCALVVEYSNGTAGNVYLVDEPYVLLGQLEISKQRILNNCFEYSERD